MDVMDEALDLLGDAGPEYGPGFSNHAPMAAEALLALGRGDAVIDWVSAYRKRLPASPEPGLPVFGGYWFEALGAIGRYADWVACFEEELRDGDWCSVLNMWVPRLLPGMVGAAWHGAIRTGHAVRSLNRDEISRKDPGTCPGPGILGRTVSIAAGVPGAQGGGAKPACRHR